MGMRTPNTRVTRSTTRKVPENRPAEIDSESESESDSESDDDKRAAEPIVSKTIVKGKKAVRFENAKEKEKETERVREKSVPHIDLPFRNVPEVLPAPYNAPVTMVKEPIPIVEDERAYKNVSRVEEGKSVKGVVDKVLNTPLTMTVGDILAMSGSARDELRQRLTRRKVPVESKALALIDGMTETEIQYWQSYLKDNEISDIVSLDDLPRASSTFMVSVGDSNLENGTIVISDPVVQFLEALPEGQPQPIIIAAKDSQALRAVWPVINNVTNEECLLDGGSQIVSMARDAAERLGLHWDPDICIHMQSANKQIEKTLGLARNVPFRFGDITVYLQVHIINSAAYKVLLGRPFDALTQSGYQNEIDGNMTMTLTCPNSRRRATFITYPRGEIPGYLRQESTKGFR